MAHWAELDDDGVVLRVVVCDADDGADGTLHPPAFLTDVLGGTWQRTYYATEGHTFAGIGARWRPDLQDFRPDTRPPTDPTLENAALSNRNLDRPGKG